MEFFWNKRIPIGKLTILAGRGGIGKSFLCLSLAAHVTSGTRLLDTEGGDLDGEVLFCSYEDDVEDTIGPRADYLGVDMERCHFITGVDTAHGKRSFGPQDVPRIIDYLKQCPDIKLIIIDPLGSFVGAGTNTSAENEMRSVLQTLVDAAQVCGAAVVVVAHLRKAPVESADDDAAMRISGSQGISAISRSVLMVERDENNLRWIKHVKSNYSAPAPDISYNFDDQGFRWNSIKRSPEDLGRWLKVTLEMNGGKMDLKEISEKAKTYGRTDEELAEARKVLGINPVRNATDTDWTWEIR